VGFGEQLGDCSAGLTSRLHVHDAGFVVTRRFRPHQRHHFTDVHELVSDTGIRFGWDRDLGSVRSQPYWRQRLTMTNGTTLRLRLEGATTRTLARDFVYYGIRSDVEPSPAGELVSVIHERVGHAQLPAACATIRAGGSVTFGAFSASSAGLHHDTAGVLPWDRFDAFERTAGYATILPPVATGAFCTAFTWVYRPPGRTYPGERQPRCWVAVPLVEVTNAETLALLADELKPATNDPQC
jgi:hypothetical protein